MLETRKDLGGWLGGHCSVGACVVHNVFVCLTLEWGNLVLAIEIAGPAGWADRVRDVRSHCLHLSLKPNTPIQPRVRVNIMATKSGLELDDVG